jgi:hypothetical protein
MLKPEDFIRVREAMTPERILAVLIDRHGIVVANDVCDEIARIERGEAKQPTVRWPRF